MQQRIYVGTLQVTEIRKMNQNILKTRMKIKNKILSLPNNFDSYGKVRQEVYNLLKRAVCDGESNSALLIGPRGIGKTSLVNNIVNELKNEDEFSSSSIFVQLNGLLHTDDRLALISITEQLNLDNAVDGKVFGSFAENLAFLLACLKTGDRKSSKSVLFIIDEFDLFCSHHNQTLLYNLFDISQSAQAPVCVLGVTSRLDVIELLEKRVKSRFSHRQYFMFHGEDSESDKQDLNRYVKQIENDLLISHEDIDPSFVKKWNKSIKNLVEDKKMKTLLQRLMDLNLSKQVLKNILVVIVSSLDDEKTEISVKDFEDELKLYEEDEGINQLQDISILELCLLISMKHHVEIYDDQPMNFEMIFTRYIKFANSSTNIQSVQRPVVMKAFEHLKNMELIEFLAESSGRLQKEYQMFRMLVSPHQIMEAVQKWQGLPVVVTQWAMSSLL